MERLIVHEDKCKGCGYCVKSCSRKALSQGSEINKKGYPYVICDHDKCITCGICFNVCPDYVFEILSVENN